MRIHIGTSGYQYPEWKGTFYPEKFSTAKMLTFYAEKFASTEINYSFRHIPSIKTLNRWSAETPEHFRFSLKAPQRITHFAKLKNCRETLFVFQQAVTELGPKLGCVLFQLPPTFEKDAELLKHFLRELPPHSCSTFEFRHSSWFDEEIFTLLKEHQVALCLAESADLATPRVATAPYGYLRLRREDYTKDDLKKVATFIKKQTWEDTFIYFKHEERGVGPAFAAIMQGLLE